MSLAKAGEQMRVSVSVQIPPRGAAIASRGGADVLQKAGRPLETLERCGRTAVRRPRRQASAFAIARYGSPEYCVSSPPGKIALARARARRSPRCQLTEA